MVWMLDGEGGKAHPSMKELDWECCVMIDEKAFGFHCCSPQQAAQCSMALAQWDSSSAS